MQKKLAIRLPPVYSLPAMKKGFFNLKFKSGSLVTSISLDSANSYSKVVRMGVNSETPTIYAKPVANFSYEEALLVQKLLANHGFYTDVVEAEK